MQSHHSPSNHALNSSSSRSGTSLLASRAERKGEKSLWKKMQLRRVQLRPPSVLLRRAFVQQKSARNNPRFNGRGRMSEVVLRARPGQKRVAILIRRWGRDLQEKGFAQRRGTSLVVWVRRRAANHEEPSDRCHRHYSQRPATTPITFSIDLLKIDFLTFSTPVCNVRLLIYEEHLSGTLSQCIVTLRSRYVCLTRTRRSFRRVLNERLRASKTRPPTIISSPTNPFIVRDNTFTRKTKLSAYIQARY